MPATVEEIDPVLVTRLHALLSRPQEFVVYDAGCGGEYITNRITEYSSKYQKSTFAPSKLDPQVNRTNITYPAIYQHIIGPNAERLESKQGLIQQLAHHDLIVDQELTLAEQFFEQCAVPLFRIHVTKSKFFLEHPTHHLLAHGIWHKYADALVLIKITMTLEDFIQHSILSRGPDSVNSCKFTMEEIRAYMTENNIVNAGYMTFRLLFSPGIPQAVQTLDELFNSTVLDLYHRFYQNTPSWFLKKRAKEVQPATFLDLSRIVREPRYLADKFHIEDWSGFHSGIVQWHGDNLRLLAQHGFTTEFDSLS